MQIEHCSYIRIYIYIYVLVERLFRVYLAIQVVLYTRFIYEDEI